MGAGGATALGAAAAAGWGGAWGGGAAAWGWGAKGLLQVGGGEEGDACVSTWLGCGMFGDGIRGAEGMMEEKEQCNMARKEMGMISMLKLRRGAVEGLGEEEAHGRLKPPNGLAGAALGGAGLWH